MIATPAFSIWRRWSDLQLWLHIGGNQPSDHTLSGAARPHASLSTGPGISKSTTGNRPVVFRDDAADYHTRKHRPHGRRLRKATAAKAAARPLSRHGTTVLWGTAVPQFSIVRDSATRFHCGGAQRLRQSQSLRHKNRPSSYGIRSLAPISPFTGERAPLEQLWIVRPLPRSDAPENKRGSSEARGFLCIETICCDLSFCSPDFVPSARQSIVYHCANSHGKRNADVAQTSRVKSGSLELFKDFRLWHARRFLRLRRQQ